MKILTALELSQLNKEQLKRCQTTTWELDSHEGPVERCESVGKDEERRAALRAKRKATRDAKKKKAGT